MSRSLPLYLEDICTSCAKVQRYTLNMILEDFVADERTYDAVVRNLQIIGEAVKQIPTEVREQYSACRMAQNSWPPRYLSPCLL